MHAELKQVEAGVDVLVVAGGEAGGHCGDVSTLILVPEVAEAIQSYADTPILAAGGTLTSADALAIHRHRTDRTPAMRSIEDCNKWPTH